MTMSILRRKRSGTSSAVIGSNAAEAQRAAYGPQSVLPDFFLGLGDQIFNRPIYAGNAIATVESTDPKTVITVRGTAFGKSEGAPIFQVVDIGFVVDLYKAGQELGSSNEGGNGIYMRHRTVNLNARNAPCHVTEVTDKLVASARNPARLL